MLRGTFPILNEAPIESGAKTKADITRIKMVLARYSRMRSVFKLRVEAADITMNLIRYISDTAKLIFKNKLMPASTTKSVEEIMKR